MNEDLKKKAYLVIQFFLYPFAIGSLWHAFGSWLGIPALVVFGTLWVGVCCLIGKYEAQPK